RERGLRALALAMGSGDLGSGLESQHVFQDLSPKAGDPESRAGPSLPDGDVRAQAAPTRTVNDICRFRRRAVCKETAAAGVTNRKTRLLFFHIVDLMQAARDRPQAGGV